MTTLSDILDVGLLEKAIKEKLVKVVKHPTLPLRIYNYTPIAQYKNEWTTEVMASRGLIVGPEDEIIARGPSKFFNYGQPGAPEVGLDQTVWVSRKEDGSLGIGWEYKGQYGIATRGSFTSEQAIHATELLTDHDKRMIKFAKTKHNRSKIYEIVYPENRIVLDYGDTDELIRLGAVDNLTGLIHERNLGILHNGGSTFGHQMTFSQALLLPIADDAEGYVIDVFDTDTWQVVGHVKLKGERYKHLHAAIYGLSARKIWEYFCESENAAIEFIADLPDELQPWANSIRERLGKEYVIYSEKISGALADLRLAMCARSSTANSRRNFAMLAKERYPNITGPLFAALDSNEERVRTWILDKIKPGHELFRTIDEDAN